MFSKESSNSIVRYRELKRIELQIPYCYTIRATFASQRHAVSDCQERRPLHLMYLDLAVLCSNSSATNGDKAFVWTMFYGRQNHGTNTKRFYSHSRPSLAINPSSL